jgi:hypothetical protein
MQHGFLLDIITVVRSALRLKPSELTPEKMGAIIEALRRGQRSHLTYEDVEAVYDLFESMKLQFMPEPTNEQRIPG